MHLSASNKTGPNLDFWILTRWAITTVNEIPQIMEDRYEILHNFHTHLPPFGSSEFLLLPLDSQKQPPQLLTTKSSSAFYNGMDRGMALAVISLVNFRGDLTRPFSAPKM